jgi:hypothetical protein
MRLLGILGNSALHRRCDTVSMTVFKGSRLRPTTEHEGYGSFRSIDKSLEKIIATVTYIPT